MHASADRFLSASSARPHWLICCLGCLGCFRCSKLHSSRSSSSSPRWQQVRSPPSKPCSKSPRRKDLSQSSSFDLFDLKLTSSCFSSASLAVDIYAMLVVGCYAGKMAEWLRRNVQDSLRFQTVVFGRGFESHSCHQFDFFCLCL